MSAIAKSVLAAALIAFGLVAGEDIARGTAAPAPFTAHEMASDDLAIREAALRERAVRTLQVLLEKQANGAAAAPVEPAPAPKCRDQTWPYYTDDCLVHSPGAKVHGAVRIVRAERLGDGS